MNIINILEIYTKTIYNIIFIYIYTMKCFFVYHFLQIITKIVAEKYMQLASEPYIYYCQVVKTKTELEIRKLD